MSRQDYTLQRRINAALQFRGLKGQYIFYGGGVLVGALVLFVVLYVADVNPLASLLVSLGIGLAGIGTVYRLSDRYGEYGWRKRIFARRVPPFLRCRSHQIFTNLKKD